MTDYRMVARHVRYWRGAIHKWSTVWPFSGTLTSGQYATAIADLKTCEQSINYTKLGNITGGLYEIALYNQASGGVPVAVATYFDWTTPASWLPYTQTIYASSSYPVVTEAETALQVEWAAGLSSSGKPVHFRKWFHAVPAEGNIPPATDITSAEAAAAVTVFTTFGNAMAALGAPMGRAGRLAAITPTVRLFYGNHQMPRGRRRKPLVTSSGRYTGPTVQVPEVPITLD